MDTRQELRLNDTAHGNGLIIRLGIPKPDAPIIKGQLTLITGSNELQSFGQTA